MTKFCINILALLLFSFYTSSAQTDSVIFLKIGAETEKAFTADTLLDNFEFGPTKILFANISAFQPGNTITAQMVRKVQLSKRFKNDDSLFQWLIPNTNRVFLTSYFYKRCNFKGKYDTLFGKLLQSFCPCISIISKSKDAHANISLENCMKDFMADSVLISEYRNLFYALPRSEQLWFLEDMLFYANIHCETMFDKLIALAKKEIPGYFKSKTELYKASLLQEAARYSTMGQKDSLKAIFPQYALYAKELAAWKKLYAENGKDLSFTIQELAATNIFERKNLLVATDNNSKIKLLGQFVYEIGVDKPILYIRNVKYYPRESLQSVEWMEQEMEKAKARIH